MITVRKSADRGHANHGWLESYHTFSFGDYYDPRFTGFRSLLVINEDFVKPGQGFPKHGHRDMEIITYILDGALEHKDSTGVGSIIRPGDVQRMSAGKGVLHSEYNHSSENPVHFLQIWIEPNQTGNPPSYEERKFSSTEKSNTLRLVASPDGAHNSVRIQQDAKLFASVLASGVQVTHSINPDRHAWIQIARGSLEINGTKLDQGDGAAISDEKEIKLLAVSETELLLFDLP